jgi:hypothetical protein
MGSRQSARVAALRDVQTSNEPVRATVHAWMDVSSSPTKITQLLSEWDGESPPPSWENWTIPTFLEAMGAWLGSYENAWTNVGEVPPTDGWLVFAQALEAGARYE